MNFEDIAKYRKALYEHFNMRHYKGVPKAFGAPTWATDLYNDLAKMHLDETK